MSLLRALTDPDYWQEVASQSKNFGQAASNAASQVVAAPVDLVNAGLGFAGMGTARPVGGTEWLKSLGLYADVPQGAARVAGETFGSILPIAVPAKAPQIAQGLLQMIANASGAPAAGGRGAQRGMIRTPYGRIPETLDERFGAVDMLEKHALKAGYQTERGAAQTGASAYLKIMDAVNNPAQFATVRFSDHAPAAKYVPDHPYFSVDPTSGGGLFAGGTQEQAYDFLAKNGFPISTLQRFSVPTDAGVMSLQDITSVNKAMAAQELAKKTRQNQSAFDADGFRVVKVETNAGKRYDAYRTDGSKVTIKAGKIPQEIKAGDRRALWEYILGSSK